MNDSQGLDTAFARMGSPTAIFSPPTLRIAIACFVMASVGGGMLVVYFFAPTAVPAESQAEASGFLITALVCLAVAAGILVHGLRTGRRRFFLCPAGLVVDQGNCADVYPWDEIVSVIENRVREGIYGIPVGSYRAAVVQRVDGAELILTRNRVRRVGKLIDAIQQQIWSRRSVQHALHNDSRLTRIVNAWLTLPDCVRSDIVAMVENAAATLSPPSASSDEMHVVLRVTQDQIDRGDTVTLNVPDLGSISIVLPTDARHGMRLRLRNALSSQSNLVAQILVDS